MTWKTHSRTRTGWSRALSRGPKALKSPENSNFTLRPHYANLPFSEAGLSSPGKIYCSHVFFRCIKNIRYCVHILINPHSGTRRCSDGCGAPMDGHWYLCWLRVSHIIIFRSIWSHPRPLRALSTHVLYRWISLQSQALTRYLDGSGPLIDTSLTNTCIRRAISVVRTSEII